MTPLEATLLRWELTCYAGAAVALLIAVLAAWTWWTWRERRD